MLFSFTLFVYAVGALISYYLVLRPLCQYFHDPLKLRRYPAPSLLAALTPLWLLRATWSQDRSRSIHRELLLHGDVLRISPNHLIFNDPAAIKDIYGVLAVSRGVAKDEFYDRLAGDAHDLVQLRDRGEHSERRKAIANAFAAKTVVNMEHVIREAFMQLLTKIESHIDAKNGREIDLRKWLNYFTLDVIGDTGFGLPLGFLQDNSDAIHAESQSGMAYRVPNLVDTLHRGVRYSVTMANVPSHHVSRRLKEIISYIPLVSKALGSTCALDFENICIGQLRHRIQQGRPARASGDFMSFILGDQNRASPDEEKRGMTYTQFRSLVADTSMILVAGSDTTAAALTSTIWFLLQTPHAIERLRRELLHLSAEGSTCHLSAEDSMFSYDEVKDLPYLRACIDESLRLRPPIAYQLPRLVSQPATIAGHDILPGTVVAVAPYSVHRLASLYPEPDEYRPERWVDYNRDYPNQREDLKKYNIVFSQGSRACIGRHLAIVELQILVSSLVMRYDMSLTDDSEKELKIFERFNSNPGPMPVRISRRSV